MCHGAPPPTSTSRPIFNDSQCTGVHLSANYLPSEGNTRWINYTKIRNKSKLSLILIKFNLEFKWTGESKLYQYTPKKVHATSNVHTDMHHHQGNLRGREVVAHQINMQVSSCHCYCTKEQLEHKKVVSLVASVT